MQQRDFDLEALRHAYVNAVDLQRAVDFEPYAEPREKEHAQEVAERAMDEFANLLDDAVRASWPMSSQRASWRRVVPLIATMVSIASAAIVILLAANHGAGDPGATTFWIRKWAWIGAVVALGLIVPAALFLRASGKQQLASQLRLQAVSRPAVTGVRTPQSGHSEAADPFALSHLWTQNESRISDYHAVASGQAARSFVYGISAAVVGLSLFVVAIVAAATARTQTGAIIAALGGAGGGGVGGYIAATFIRMQQNSAELLQRYFSQPSDMMRVLAAERVADSLEEGSSDWIAARREIVSALLQEGPGSIGTRIPDDAV